jgi:hypothetical protein
MEREDGCLVPEETQTPATLRSDVRVDRGTECAARVAPELVGARVEPVSWFVHEAELRDRLPERERDADDHLVRVGFSTRHYVPADDAIGWVRREPVRSE